MVDYSIEHPPPQILQIYKENITVPEVLERNGDLYKAPYLLKIHSTYFVIVGRNFIEIGEDFNMAFDVFFKIFPVFNIEYDNINFKSFFKFFQFFVYKTKNGSAGIRLENFYKYMTNN